MKKLLYILGLPMLLFSCSKKVIKDQQDFINDMELTCSKTSLVADTYDNALIVFTLPNDADTESVTLATTIGAFAGQKTKTLETTLVNIDGELRRKCQAIITSTRNTGNAYVTATFNEMTKQISIPFTRAYPNSIFMRVDSLNTIHGNQKFTFSSHVARSSGKPSTKTIIYATAHDADTIGKQVGNFLSPSWGATGDDDLISFDFVLGSDSCNCKKIKMCTYTIGANNDTLKDFKLINVN